MSKETFVCYLCDDEIDGDYGGGNVQFVFGTFPICRNMCTRGETMTDQRDTPRASGSDPTLGRTSVHPMSSDTRTPSAEGCDHDRHQSVRDSADASDVRWGHISGDFGVTPWEPCPEPAPLGDATTDAEPTEQALPDHRSDKTVTKAQWEAEMAAANERLRLLPLTAQEREVIVGALDNFVQQYTERWAVDPAYIATARSARAKILAGVTP